MAQKTDKAAANTSKDKILVQIGEHRKEWVTNVATLAQCAQAEIVRVLVDMHAHEDPESFVIKVEKFRLKMRLEDLDRRETAIQQEREQTIKDLESKGAKREELIPSH